MTKVPVLTVDQMREVDRSMIEDYQMDLVQMMENAGRQLALLAQNLFLGGDPRGRRVLVLVGAGGNGGGGLVAARRLHCWGARVQVVLSRSADTYRNVPAHQLAAVLRLGIPVSTLDAVDIRQSGRDRSGEDDSRFGVVLDSIIGYGLEAAPMGEAAELIRWAHSVEAPILSLDVPSGLDTTFGAVGGPMIRARATLTLAYPKTGLLATGAGDYVGDLYVGDIGVPPQLVAGPRLGFEPILLFAQEEIVSLAGATGSVASDVEISIQALLRATGQAHHRAFASSGGVDADWAQWYGGRACPALEGLLGKAIGSEPLGRLLAEASDAREREAPGIAWESFYAGFLLKRLGLPPDHTQG
ncbi:MAG: NAD(P)H-hydrate epimerase [bacterium]